MAVDEKFPPDGAGHIGTDERKDIWFDCSPQLCNHLGEQVDTVRKVTWSAEPNELTLDEPYIQGNYVGVFVSNTQAETYYRVKAHVETNDGRIFDAIWGIGGVAK